jgi:hypothetical protein
VYIFAPITGMVLLATSESAFHKRGWDLTINLFNTTIKEVNSFGNISVANKTGKSLSDIFLRFLNF